MLKEALYSQGTLPGRAFRGHTDDTLQRVNTKAGQWAVVVRAFSPSILEAETGGSLSLRPAWSTRWVLGQSELHREPCLRTTQQ